MPSELRRMIEAQPAALESLAGDAAATAEAADRLAAATRIWLVGTGTSRHAAELAAHALEGLGRDARWAPAAAFATRPGLLRPGDATILLSHTGRTAYARRARRMVLESGRPLVSITGPDAGWPEAITTAVGERSETYTVSHTSALGVLAQLVEHLGGPAADLRATAKEVRAVIAAPDVADVPLPARAMAIVAPGPWAVTAREGALKIREAARLLCEGFDPEHLLHGSAVPYTAADTLLVLRPEADPDGLTAAVAEAAAREGVAVATLSGGPAGDALTAQIRLTVRLQLLALRFAEQRCQDPDVAITGAWADERLWQLGEAADGFTDR